MDDDDVGLRNHLGIDHADDPRLRCLFERNRLPGDKLKDDKDFDMKPVTGEADFAGSDIVAALCDRGEAVAVRDRLRHEENWRNIAKRAETSSNTASEAMP